ncbi:MAG: tape measure protein [Gammaproteobacteria bacterium]|nr:tape measure protein [Gammaproteobacteria bacterium]
MASKQLELALRIAAKVSGREDLAGLADTVRDVGKEADDATPSAKDLGNELEKLGQQKAQIDAFNDSRRALIEFERQTAEMAGSLDALQRELRDTADPSEQLRNEVAAAERALESQRAELLQHASAHNKLQTELKQSGIATDQVRVAEKQVKEQISATTKELEKQGKEAAGTAGKNKTFGESVSGVTTRLLALAGTYFGVRKLWDGLKAILSTGDQFERLDKQLAAVMGSIEDGEQAAAWIKEFAKDTPLELEQVTQIFTRLKAFGLDPMNGSMQAVVDQAYKLGGSFETVEGISLALGQAWAKQKLQGDEILRLVERGVPVWDMLAKATGKNTVELQALSSAGRLGRAEIKALMDEIAASSQGAAQSQMSTLSGLISNLKDTYTSFVNDIAEAGVLEYFKGQLQALSAEISRMAQSGELQVMAKRISDSIISAAESVKGFITTLWEARTAIGSLAAVAATVKLWQMFSGVVAVARTAVVAIGTVTAATASAAVGVGVLAKALRVTLVGAVTYSAAALVQLGSAWREMRAAQRDADEAALAAAQQQSAVREQLAALSQQLGLSITDMDQFNSLVDDGTIVWDEAAGTWTTAAAQLAAMAPAMDSTAAAAAALTDRTAALVAEFTRTMSEGKGAEEAIRAVFEAANVGDAEGMLALQRALQQLAGESDAVASAIRDGVRKQLADMTATELAEFGRVARDSFGGAEQWADSAGLANAALTESFARLGLDINEVRGEMTAAGADALALFQSIAADAQVSGAAIQTAFEAALGKLRNSTEVDALRAQVVELGKAGKLSGDQLKAMLESLERRTAAVIPGVQTLEEAFAALGLTAQEELDKAAESARAAFAVIKAQGSFDDQKRAFESYARAVMAANKGIADSALQAQAEMLGMGDALNNLGQGEDGNQSQRTESALNSVNEVVGRLRENSDRTRDAVGSLSSQIQQVVENTDQGTREIGNAIYGLSERTQAAAANLSAATEQLYLKFMLGRSGAEQFRTEADELRDKIGQLGTEITDLQHKANSLFDSTGLSTYMIELRQASNKAQIAYYEQRLEIERLIYTMEQAGGATAGWVAEAERTVERMDLLNESDLSGITGQINQAKQAMESLRNSAESTLTSLREELAQLQGNYAEAEKIRQAQRRTELESQLTTAKAYGDRDAIAQLTEALKLLDQVSKIQIAEAQQRSQEKATQKTTTTTNSSGRKATLELQLPGGPVQLDTTDESLELLTRRLATLSSVSAG